MFPNIIIFGKEISAYMICALVGIFVSLFFVYNFTRKQGLNEIRSLFAMLFAGIGVLIGSHLLYGLTVPDRLADLFSFSFSSFDDFVNKAVAAFGGAVFYGGLIGGIIAAYIYLSKEEKTLMQYSDICSLGIPLFHFFGRLGCFFSGCCFGIESEFGIVYHHSPIEIANGVTRFPIQLCEAIFNLLLFFFLFYLYKKGKCKEKILPVYLLVYPVGRFIFEFFRGDEYRGFVGIFSTSQFISIILFSAALIYLVLKKFKKKAD